MRDVGKILWDRKGITPVLSNVLLMMIAVGAMSITITATYVITGNLRETMGERLVVEDVWFTNGKIAMHLLNVGKIRIKIVSVYVNYTSQSFTPLELDVSGHGWLNVTQSWVSNSAYYINIVTTRGTKVADYYRSPT